MSPLQVDLLPMTLDPEAAETRFVIVTYPSAAKLRCNHQSCDMSSSIYLIRSSPNVVKCLLPWSSPGFLDGKIQRSPLSLSAFLPFLPLFPSLEG